jgi:hypothetical protein
VTKMAQDYGDIAEDLQSGAIEIRDCEQMPQLAHQGLNRAGCDPGARSSS